MPLLEPICRHPLWSLAACIGQDILFYIAGACTVPVIGWTIFKRIARGPRRPPR